MGHWQQIRQRAEKLRLAEAFDELSNAEKLVRGMAARLGLTLCAESPNSAHLRKSLAVIEYEDEIIYFNNELPDWFKYFCIAHEIGHFVFGHQSGGCAESDIQTDAAEDGPEMTAKVAGYSSAERREREANLFALEFLLPRTLLRRAFLERGQTMRDICRATGFPAAMVAAQLAQALLVPAENINEEIDAAAIKTVFDESQQRAIDMDGPVLVTAGPGTGKTHTLIGRLMHLIDSGVDPARILALTFSNKAAEEMRERIAAERPAAAGKIHLMTFHAYGLELLRKFAYEGETAENFGLLDKIGALRRMEERSAELDLDHYLLMHDPALKLPAILAAISRAKDELCTAEEYTQLADEMLSRADTDDAIAAAEKAVEAARAYRIYQNILKEEGAVDFGDLIHGAVRLLRSNAGVKAAVTNSYDAVVVDEFQDVNRACGVLLKEVAGDGKGLWAVGDLRQSIYRWRGASPANLERFTLDYPNAKIVSLEKNYRSRPPIVEMFSNFAGQMIAGGTETFHQWQPDREPGIPGTAITFDVAGDVKAEAEQIAARIKQHQAAGVELKDCAIICRTHGQLEKFAAALAANDIPLFYLGEIFEREEVRNLLALIDLRHSADGISLLRAAKMAEFGMPFEDVKKLVDMTAKDERPFLEVIADAEMVASLSPEGRSGGAALVDLLTSYSPEVSAWDLLTGCLFDKRIAIGELFAENDVQARSKRLAVYQLLRAARSFSPPDGGAKPPLKAFLEHVRRLAYFNADKDYAQMPEEAAHLDAVRLLTVHSAKGLEFRVVFLPYLGASKFPVSKRTTDCPPPAGMIDGHQDFQVEEEQCLFFVALSRARDHLHLSRAEFYGKRSSNASPFLDSIAALLPPANVIPASADRSSERDAKGLAPAHFSARSLQRFVDCGAKYFYSDVLFLRVEFDSAYVDLHSRLVSALAEACADESGNGGSAAAHFERSWDAAENAEKKHSDLYRRKGRMLLQGSDALTKLDLRLADITQNIEIGDSTVKVKLSAISSAADGTIRLYIIKPGRKPNTYSLRPQDVLMMEAARKLFPAAKPQLMGVYLRDGATKDLTPKERAASGRLTKVEKAIDDIRNRHFEPKVSDSCPACEYFFICPSNLPKSEG